MLRRHLQAGEPRLPSITAKVMERDNAMFGASMTGSLPNRNPARLLIGMIFLQIGAVYASPPESACPVEAIALYGTTLAVWSSLAVWHGCS